MDNRPIARAEDMPILYRTVLDGVAELARYDRPRAERIRRAAIHAYSIAWNRTQYAHLEVLAGQLESRLARHRRSAQVGGVRATSARLVADQQTG